MLFEGSMGSYKVIFEWMKVKILPMMHLCINFVKFFFFDWISESKVIGLKNLEAA